LINRFSSLPNVGYVVKTYSVADWEDVMSACCTACPVFVIAAVSAVLLSQIKSNQIKSFY